MTIEGNQKNQFDMKFLFLAIVLFSYVFINVNMEVAKHNVKRILVRRIRKIPQTNIVSNNLILEENNSNKRKTIDEANKGISTSNHNYTLALTNLKKSVEMLSTLYNQRRVEKVLDGGGSDL